MNADPNRAGELLLDALAERLADRVAGRMIAAFEAPVERAALSIEEAAHALSLSKATVERLVAAGRLPVKRVGQRRIIAIEDVHRFAQDRAAVDTGADQ